MAREETFQKNRKRKMLNSVKKFFFFFFFKSPKSRVSHICKISYGWSCNFSLITTPPLGFLETQQSCTTLLGRGPRVFSPFSFCTPSLVRIRLRVALCNAKTEWRIRRDVVFRRGFATTFWVACSGQRTNEKKKYRFVLERETRTFQQAKAPLFLVLQQNVALLLVASEWLTWLIWARLIVRQPYQHSPRPLNVTVSP